MPSPILPLKGREKKSDLRSYNVGATSSDDNFHAAVGASPRLGNMISMHDPPKIDLKLLSFRRGFHDAPRDGQTETVAIYRFCYAAAKKRFDDGVRVRPGNDVTFVENG